MTSDGPGQPFGPAAPSTPASPDPRNGARWLAAGLIAGATLGALDTAWVVARGVGGMSFDRGLLLILFGASWMAVAGVLAAGLIAAGGAVAQRFGARRARVAGLLAALAAAPGSIAVAFAAFTGHQAASIPGHRALSLALALAAMTAAFAGARWFIAADGDARSREAAAGWRLRAVLFAAGTAAGALAAEVANHLVLRRLYPWFHAGLTAVSGLGLLLSAKLLVGHLRFSRVPAGAGRQPRALVIALAATAALAVTSGIAARRSQTLRFAAGEKTAALAQLLRISPVSLRAHTYFAGERQSAEVTLPPLPDGPRRPDADVLVVTVDALRADHVGAWGYRRRPTTPNIDALAARSVRFARAYAQAPHTSFSVASMLTGKYFPTLARLAPAEVHDPIASLLRQYGWHTAGFYPPAVFFVDSQKLKAYADSHFSFEYVKFEYLEAQKRVDQVVRYYETEKPKRSFVWVHFFEPHEPYVAQPGFAFGSGDVDRYDGEIAYADAAIGRLLAWIAAHRPGTIVILAADHGEEFDEHGGRYHGSSLYDEQVHVPLLISVPGIPPRVVEHPVELIDVTPTVLNLLDIPVSARMRGTDLGPWLATPPPPESRLPPAFAEVEDKRMVVDGQDKLICDLNWGYCAYHDLRVDPGEKHNAADEHPDRAAALRRTLDQWLDGHVRLEPVLARGASNPNGEQIPRAIERGRLGDLLAGPELASLMLSTDEPVAVRREAAELLVSLPPRKETAAQLALASNDRDALVASWAAVGAVRAGDGRAAARVIASLGDRTLPQKLRVRGALALAARGDGAGVPTLAEALDQCQDDVLFCRLIIIQMGKLRDRRAAPALLQHLSEVQNRREMVDALGDIGDPAAVPALIERLRHDEYVPVRAQAARALAKIGRIDVLPALQRAVEQETEASVAAAAREAIAALRAGRPG